MLAAVNYRFNDRIYNNYYGDLNMNIFFQWLQRNISVIAIAISLISLTLSIMGFVRSSTSTQKQKKWYRLKKLWSVRYSVFHVIVFLCLSCYVLLNWEECISMQFFSQFDGNNILFLVWINPILVRSEHCFNSFPHLYITICDIYCQRYYCKKYIFMIIYIAGGKTNEN